MRTQVLGRAPGFAPGPPVVGPYRPVVLRTGAPGVRLRAWLEGTTGVVEVDGERYLELPDVELWWPHTHGTPRLHDVTVDGEVVGRVGFRTVENRSEDSLDLWVNGVRVFARGAVWTPGDLAALDEAVALGMNAVRVPGTGAYESDAFHDRCDELGLLVWQDLMFATFDYPLVDDVFRAAVTVEVADQCARLLPHPSTVVVCGSAEHEQQAALFGVSPATGAAAELAALLRPVVADSGLDAVWVDSSPCGGDPVTRVDTGIAQYFGVGAYLRDLPDVRHSRVGFAAECLAFSNLTDPVVDGGVPRDHGADWDFADVRDHYLRARYGPDATEAEAQRVTGEVMAEVFGEWRRPGSGCGGGLVLWLRDLAPGAGWGLLDHVGRPKPAALALAPVLQPTAVWLVDEGLNGLDVHVSHDGPDAIGCHPHGRAAARGRVGGRGVRGGVDPRAARSPGPRCRGAARSVRRRLLRLPVRRAPARRRPGAARAGVRGRAGGGVAVAERSTGYWRGVTHDRRPAREAALQAVSTAGGAALGALFGTLGRVRPASRPLHPRGQVLHGVLHREGATPAIGVPWLDETGEDPVLVRTLAERGPAGAAPRRVRARRPHRPGRRPAGRPAPRHHRTGTTHPVPVRARPKHRRTDEHRDAVPHAGGPGPSRRPAHRAAHGRAHLRHAHRPVAPVRAHRARLRALRITGRRAARASPSTRCDCACPG